MADRHFRADSVEQVTLVQLLDPRLFDTLIISELQDELIEYLEEEKPQQVLVSFEGVTHCSTSVINALLRAKKRVIADGGRLKLCGMSAPIREAYQMLNLDGTVFDIYDTREEGLNAFAAGNGDEN